MSFSTIESVNKIIALAYCVDGDVCAVSCAHFRLRRKEKAFLKNTELLTNGE
jgi:hypothetical protein